MSKVAVLALLIFALKSPNDRLDQLARSGMIQENAPVKASLEITINAPPEKVWGVLTDVGNWPKWHKDITWSTINGPLQSGTEFTWTAGAKIHSRIALVQPPEQFGWTGVATGARAIHLWKLQRQTDGKTLVKTTESLEGFLLPLFLSSKRLEEIDRRWLNDLKVAAEQ